VANSLPNGTPYPNFLSQSRVSSIEELSNKLIDFALGENGRKVRFLAVATSKPHRLHSSYEPEYRESALKRKKRRKERKKRAISPSVSRAKTCVLDTAREHTFSLTVESFPLVSFLSMLDVAGFANSLTKFADGRGIARARISRNAK